MTVRAQELVSEDETCTSIFDAPNPISNDYPNSATGVLNGTIALIPVELEKVKAVLPAGIKVLEEMYRDALPDFPEGMYPVLLQAAHDHDIRFAAYNMVIPDFSRMGLEFPFLDLRGDGTPFKWAPIQLISEHNEMAIQGSIAYKTKVFSSLFAAKCEAYSSDSQGTFTMNAASAEVNVSRSSIETSFKRESGNDIQMPFNLDAFKVISDQITFADVNGQCNRFVRLWNTTIDSTPIPVKGKITLEGAVSPLQSASGKIGFENVWGMHLATPFKEDNYLNCANV